MTTRGLTGNQNIIVSINKHIMTRNDRYTNTTVLTINNISTLILINGLVSFGTISVK